MFDAFDRSSSQVAVEIDPSVSKLKRHNWVTLYEPGLTMIKSIHSFKFIYIQIPSKIDVNQGLLYYFSVLQSHIYFRFTDVFHWSCLDHFARQLPPNTDPGGHTCHIRKSGIFPAHNAVSTVADVLRQGQLSRGRTWIPIGIYILCLMNNLFGYYASNYFNCTMFQMPNFCHWQNLALVFIFLCNSAQDILGLPLFLQVLFLKKQDYHKYDGE